jgi:hypothetical protein
MVLLAMACALMEIVAAPKGKHTNTHCESFCGKGADFCEENSASGLQFFPQKRPWSMECNSCQYPPLSSGAYKNYTGSHMYYPRDTLVIQEVKIDAALSNIWHEIVEMITNPWQNAWVSLTPKPFF